MSDEAPARSGPRPLLRVFNALLFGTFAAIGFGLVARPALLAFRSLGLAAPVLPWDVPLGRLFIVLALGLAIETLRLGLDVSAGKRLRPIARAPLLLLLGISLLARNFAGEPLAPVSAVPRLVSGLRTAADALDRSFATDSRYPKDPAPIDASLAQLGPTGFVYLGNYLPLRAQLLEQQKSAQITPRPGDRPGTVYVALDAEHTRAIVSVLTLDAKGKPDILRAPSGKALLVEARFGTHSSPGRDPLVPEYPGMQTPSAGKQSGPK